MKAKYSPKVDVYSFGILTLEIISGQQSSTPSARGQTAYLLEKVRKSIICLHMQHHIIYKNVLPVTCENWLVQAYECLRLRNPTGLVDSSLGSQYDDKVAKRIIYLAMQCINHDPNQRPTMSDVVKILEGKKKIENILAPIAVDDLTLGKAAVSFSQSSHSASTSVEGASDSTLSLSTNKEIDESSI
jgi:serine/threonine protein kinase